MFSLQVVPRKRSFSKITIMAPPTGTHLPASPLHLLESRGLLLKASLPDPLPHHRAIPGGCDAVYKALKEYTTYYLTLRNNFADAVDKRKAQLNMHLSSNLMSLVTYMRELEALFQHCSDTQLELVSELQAFLPVLSEPMSLPGVLELFERWEAKLVKTKVNGMIVIRARCVVAARAVNPLSMDEEEVAFRERFLGNGDDGSAVKKAKVSTTGE
ncbi:hypothetical protein EG328_003249 [Venturia inaequalis]|uniref:Uncharacterized protein n=1 Tax=Venturia inaequalis TaxID=5025 RepID=A0A8H3YVD6_VENIN|nr:hypothetical protein EG328_003249 [Venturia inaequalis]RDI81173.1 DNA-directed RNA polymerase I subunit [Venturia inaequalis]